MVYQPNPQYQPRFGFRYVKPSPHAPATAPLGQPTTPQQAPTTPRPGPVSGTADTQALPEGEQTVDQGTNEREPLNNRGVAEGLGYTPTDREGIPGVLTAAKRLFGQTDYGRAGTFDEQGNVFGSTGRAYNPITGRPEQNFANLGAYADTVGSGYQNLRAAGHNPVAAAFGSYERSPHYFSDQGIDPAYADAFGLSPLQLQGYDTTASNVFANTTGHDIFGEEQEFVDITPEALGATQTGAGGRNYAELSDNTGVFGTGAGDIFSTGENIGVLQDSGQLATAQGTVIQSDATGGRVVQEGSDARFTNPFLGHGGIEQPDSQVNVQPAELLSTPQDVGAPAPSIFNPPREDREERTTAQDVGAPSASIFTNQPAQTTTTNLTTAQPQQEEKEESGGK